MLEDAMLLGDTAAVASLFHRGAVLIAGSVITSPEQALPELAKRGYVASTRTLTMRGDLAVAISEHAVNICGRNPHGAWKLAATILRPESSHGG